MGGLLFSSFPNCFYGSWSAKIFYIFRFSFSKLYLNTQCYHYSSLKILLFQFFFFDLTVIVQRVKKFPGGRVSLFSDFVNFQWYYIVIRLLSVLFLFSGIYRQNVKAFMTIQISSIKPDISYIFSLNYSSLRSFFCSLSKLLK